MRLRAQSVKRLNARTHTHTRTWLTVAKLQLLPRLWPPLKVAASATYGLQLQLQLPLMLMMMKMKLLLSDKGISARQTDCLGCT